MYLYGLQQRFDDGFGLERKLAKKRTAQLRQTLDVPVVSFEMFDDGEVP